MSGAFRIEIIMLPYVLAAAFIIIFIILHYRNNRPERIKRVITELKSRLTKLEDELSALEKK